MTPRPRLDAWLVEVGHAESREKARALVMAGRVVIDGEPRVKPGTPVRDPDRVRVLPGPRHVGRGASKLEGALDAFSIDVTDAVADDVGASTGGFTQVLLERGARIVYAVDVGRAQLHDRLRRDGRVVVLERLNARSLSPEVVPEPCTLATMDVSFISILKILPALSSVLSSGADVATLVKPQFEVGKDAVGRGGVVRDPQLHRSCLETTARACQRLGFSVVDACASPLPGATGNREFFLHLRASATPATASLDEMISRALAK